MERGQVQIKGACGEFEVGNTGERDKKRQLGDLHLVIQP